MNVSPNVRKLQPLDYFSRQKFDRKPSRESTIPSVWLVSLGKQPKISLALALLKLDSSDLREWSQLSPSNWNSWTLAPELESLISAAIAPTY